MRTNKEIIIIGGGIIGLACAHYLMEQNKSVRIIEQNEIGSGASHGNCGLLHFSGLIPLCSPGTVKHEMLRSIRRTSPLYIKPRIDFPLLHWLFKFAGACNAKQMKAATTARNEILKYSLDLYEALFSTFNFECDFEKKGLLTLFKDKSYFQKYAQTNARLEPFGFEAEQLDATQTRALVPAVKKTVIGSWFNPHDWHLRPEKLIHSWKKHLIKKGLIIEEHSGLIDFEIHNNTIKQARTVKGNFKADAFILATGAWASKIQSYLNCKVPIQPGKGYSITMEKPDIAPSLPCLLYERNMVATPWNSGYRLGGTMEFSGFNDSLDKKRLSKLIAGAQEYLQTSNNEPIVEQWTGLRPMTFDDLPIIGFAKGLNNLILATGHGMLGVTMATGTAKAVCDLVTTGKSEINLLPFSPDRF